MRKAVEVSEQDGFRRFAFTMLVAVLLGLGVQFALSPAKIEKIARVKIEESPIRDNFSFGSAELSLADGFFPDLALVLSRVEWRLPNVCPDAPPASAPIRAGSMRIPLKLSSLLIGKLSAGRISFDELSIDLNDLKGDCRDSVFQGGAMPSAVATALNISSSPVKLEGLRARELWNQDDQERFAKILDGVRVSRAEIFFENRMKSVVLEGASASWRGDGLQIATVLRFPPATVFGENLPTLKINGMVRKNELIAEVRADVNEGTIEATAVFKPVQAASGSKELETDLNLSVKDLPLSLVTPLLTKAGIVSGKFQPKFMWLDCGAKVHGVFSRLFLDHPVALSQCELSGQVGKASLQTALRLPNGQWRPFEVMAKKIDLARVFETFDIRKPDEMFASLGTLSGKLRVESPVAVRLDGAISGAVMRFPGGEGAALQPLSIDRAEVELSEKKWRISFSEFKVDGGSADLWIRGEVALDGRSAKVEADLKALKFGPRAEKAIFSGRALNVAGTGLVKLRRENNEAAKIDALKVNGEVTGLEGSEIATDSLKIDAALKSDHKIEVSARAPLLEVPMTSHLFRILQPTLLGWGGERSKDGQRLLLNRVTTKGTFEDEGFHWTQASASVGRVLTLSSRGTISSGHKIQGSIDAAFPSISKLKWNLQGTWMKPVMAAASPELIQLLVRAGLPIESVTGEISPRILGLPKAASDEDQPK